MPAAAAAHRDTIEAILPEVAEKTRTASSDWERCVRPCNLLLNPVRSATFAIWPTPTVDDEGEVDEVVTFKLTPAD